MQKVNRIVDHRSIHRCSNLTASVAMKICENFSGNQLERVEKNEFLALEGSLESLYCSGK